MPHIIIEYSDNIETKMRLDDLIEKVHTAAIETGVFKEGGLRVRAAKREHYKIGDGHPDNGFIHVELKIGPGRDKATKQHAVKDIFAVVDDHLKPLHENGPLAMSIELNEFDGDIRINKNNMPEHIAKRTGR